MPRHARLVLPGIPHLLVQRGNYRQNVFLSATDYQVYLNLLKTFAERAGLWVLGYCLLPNHAHLLAIPSSASSLARAVGQTHVRYAQRANTRLAASGHLWQGRFFSCPLEEVYVPAALRYIERNPVRAELAKRPWEYLWSSASAHSGGLDDSGLLDMNAWHAHHDVREWRDYLNEPDDDVELEIFRQHVQIGRPLGRDDFLDELETVLGRRVRPLPVGRPKKVDASREPA